MTSAVDALRDEVEQGYRRRTPTSARLYEQARESFPGGDTRQTVFFKPYPLFLDGGAGAYVEDADGNRLLDCSNCWSTQIFGYAHPAVVDAVTQQLGRGTAFNAANRPALELAETLRERLPSLESIRFTNTGSEATMLAVRAARAFTSRRDVVKMVGAYHGAHDDWQVAGGRPQLGLIPGVADHVLEVPFNDKDEIARLLDERGDDIAAVIVEGIMGVAGMLPPLNDYLLHLRAETARRGVVLILDEVISFRLAGGGAQELYGLRPDLTALGKIIGGGFPVGAFGGRRDLMEQFSPLNPEHLNHSGTFNANPVSMVAGLATLRDLDADTIAYANRLGERFAGGVRRVADEQNAPLKVTGVGSLRNLHFAARPPRDALEASRADKALLHLLHLKLISLGILTVARGMYAFSTVTTPDEVDGVVERIGEALRWLQPAIKERAADRLA